MVDLVKEAIPFFVLLLVLEAVTFHIARHHDHDHGHDYVGYDTKDSATSLSMGLGNVVIEIGWKAALLAAYVGLYELTPLRLDSHSWVTWVALFFAEDFSYYWYHRAGHRIRLFWASHVVHHSSQHFNLSTALRQTWTPMHGIFFWAWMPLVGFKPWMIFLANGWSLLYQFWIHTERIHKLPRWFEFVFNTPSHHRVHHGSNPEYLDKNYAGILMIWDRMFGSFEPERERVVYGLTKNIQTNNPVRVAFHEYADIAGDVKRARTGVRGKLGYMFGPPGWAEGHGAAAAAEPDSVLADSPA